MNIPRWLGWMIFLAVVIGLFVQVPRLIVRGYPTLAEVQAADKIAGAHWSHMYGRQTDRACESIQAVNQGNKIQGGWR